MPLLMLDLLIKLSEDFKLCTTSFLCQEICKNGAEHIVLLRCRLDYVKIMLIVILINRHLGQIPVLRRCGTLV